MGADGRPLIAYSYATPEPKVARCNDLRCTSAVSTTLAGGGLPGTYTSVAIGTDGLPLISFVSGSGLAAAHCSDPQCSNAIVTTLDENAHWSTSVTIGADGLPLISYYDRTSNVLKAARCRDLQCSSASVMTIDSIETLHSQTSVTIGIDGLPLISYYDAMNRDLKVVHCGSPFCVPYFRRR